MWPEVGTKPAGFITSLPGTLTLGQRHSDYAVKSYYSGATPYNCSFQTMGVISVTYLTEALEGKLDTTDFNDIHKCKMLRSCIVLLIQRTLNILHLHYKPSCENKAVLFH